MMAVLSQQLFAATYVAAHFLVSVGLLTLALAL